MQSLCNDLGIYFNFKLNNILEIKQNHLCKNVDDSKKQKISF